MQIEVAFGHSFICHFFQYLGRGKVHVELIHVEKVMLYLSGS